MFAAYLTSQAPRLPEEMLERENSGYMNGHRATSALSGKRKFTHLKPAPVTKSLGLGPGFIEGIIEETSYFRGGP